MNQKILIASSLFTLTASAFAYNNQPIHDVNIGIGSKGVELGYTHSITDSIHINPSISYLEFKKNDVDVGNVNFDAKLKSTQVGAKINYYPFNDSNHYVSAGLYYNDMKIKGDGISNVRLYRQNAAITTNADVKYNQIAPYIGLGYQSRETQSNLKFNYQIGALYIGKADINQGNYCINLTQSCYSESDLKKNFSNNQNVSQYVDNYKNNLKDKTKYKILPVIQIGLSYSF